MCATKGIMQHKVIVNLRMVNGGKSLFGQWRQRLVTTMSQVGDVHDQIVFNLVCEIDLGKELDTITGYLEGSLWRSVQESIGRRMERFDGQGGERGKRQDQNGS